MCHLCNIDKKEYNNSLKISMFPGLFVCSSLRSPEGEWPRLPGDSIMLAQNSGTVCSGSSSERVSLYR